MKQIFLFCHTQHVVHFVSKMMKRPNTSPVLTNCVFARELWFWLLQHIELQKP
uniref:Uncharacterized protein n=1 Tax=Arundo donax TaxID=35708 RepID=A0A0A9GV52_ARUDO